MARNPEDMENYVKSFSEQFYEEQEDVLKEYNDWGKHLLRQSVYHII